MSAGWIEIYPEQERGYLKKLWDTLWAVVFEGFQKGAGVL
jgi:hypothetical protein